MVNYMSQRNVRGDIESNRPFEANKKFVFLDYGELIMHYDFNKNTLFRAHNYALEVLSRSGFPTSLENLSQAHNQAIKSYLERRRDSSEMKLDDIMTMLLDNLQVPKELREPKVLSYDFGPLNHDLAQVYEANDHDISPMPTTIESVPRLMEIARLGIISNLPHNSLVFELMNHGLYGFNPIVVSHEVGYRKPNPAIYQEALRRANIRAEEGTFFSHEQEEVDGAIAVGMQGYLVKNLGEALAKLQTSKI